MNHCLLRLRLPCHAIKRCYTTTVKPSVKLLAQLRKETEISISKAKEALVKSGNDYEKALAWLAEDAQVSGAKKAQKVAGRKAGEGLVTVASVQSRSTIIELNCETDFVSRNDIFKNLASRIAATSLLLHDSASSKVTASGRPRIETVPQDSLLLAPLMPHPEQTETELNKSVQETIVETIGKIGENIALRRAAAVEGGISAAYVHGGDGVAGKMAGLAVLMPRGVTVAELEESEAAALAKTARQIARQVVGYSPTYLTEEDVPKDKLEAESNPSEFISSTVLTKQPFLLKPDQTVADYVDQAARDAGIKNGAEVVDFVRFQVGESIDQ
ncbi:Elongation factor Ts, mitochondrial [Apophysomyces sp. BC1034]|nr:Elongation factor Ts, mitochondrial [Apophysomyces sp. BC1015]KAG0171348.1 Elongation factor Ts, mitochondrial [Apophysomyces sp. BC1021]KAG0184835.1 Elongation factor Ts, mitochondrial [Apophysomyces sp. BC1034]